MVVQCELLSLHRSGVYYVPRPVDERTLLIQRRIDEIYTACPFYGIRKITAQLRGDGLVVNHKAVARHMQVMGLRAIYPGPNLSKRAQQHAVYPYLLRGLKIARPNQVWGVDITYIRLRSGWMYLFAVLDWFSRFVVSWTLDLTLEIGFVLEAMRSALASATPTSATPIRAATSPARSTWRYFRIPRYASAWMARDVHWTTSSPSACGARSNTRRSI